jgi:hypothetical protein
VLRSVAVVYEEGHVRDWLGSATVCIHNGGEIGHSLKYSGRTFIYSKAKEILKTLSWSSN